MPKAVAEKDFDDPINQPTADMGKEAIQRGAAERGAGVAFVVEMLWDQGPPKGILRFHIRAANISLDPARGEIVRSDVFTDCRV